MALKNTKARFAFFLTTVFAAFSQPLASAATGTSQQNHHYTQPGSKASQTENLMPLSLSLLSSNDDDAPSLHQLERHWNLYPKTYFAPRTSARLINNIDGDLTKPAWSAAAWSSDFDDIRGQDDSPPEDRPPLDGSCRTRMKMIWDDEYLFIGAHMTSINRTVVSTFTHRNSPIYQEDSDIEVFVDPAGCCHQYKELEVNGHNTFWNLLLDKPYGDGGEEHSGRIARPEYGDRYWDVKKQRTAIKLLWGKFNDPGGAIWTVEMAIAHSESLSRYERIFKSEVIDKIRPRGGIRWRINLSRVEEKGKINWTWAPQIVWYPEQRRYAGFVQMHLPDAWGYVHFLEGGANSLDAKVGDNDCDRIVAPAHQNKEDDQSLSLHLAAEEVSRPRVPASSANLDSTWPARLAAMNLYYAQHRHAAVNNGKFAGDLSKLRPFLDWDIVSPFDVAIDLVPSGESTDDKTKSMDKTSGFLAKVYLAADRSVSIYGPTRRLVVSVTDDRFLSVFLEDEASLSQT